MIRQISPQGVDFIMRWEGYREKAYLCSAGVPTIGVGHTKGVKLGDTATREQILAWLREDLEDAENCINRWVTEPLNQAQFDALVSFVFNVGPGRQGVFGVGGKGFLGSSVFKELTLGDMRAAADAMLPWNKETRGGKKVESVGLTRRRKAERELFLTGVYG